MRIQPIYLVKAFYVKRRAFGAVIIHTSKNRPCYQEIKTLYV